MQKNYRNFLRSFVAIPFLATQLAIVPMSGVVANLPTAAVISPDQNRNLTSEIVDNHLDPLAVEAGKKIDAYFGQYDASLEGEGYTLAKAALDNDLPVFSLAGIAMTETRGGDTGCAIRMNNPYGYGSCKISFDSIDEATTTVARALAAKNSKNAFLYADKTFKQKLRVYNSADRLYFQKVTSVMNQISLMEVPRPTLAGISETKA